jgi:hypothetical protein
VQVGDQHDGGIDATAPEAVLDGVALELMESDRDAGKARQKRDRSGGRKYPATV